MVRITSPPVAPAAFDLTRERGWPTRASSRIDGVPPSASLTPPGISTFFIYGRDQIGRLATLAVAAYLVLWAFAFGAAGPLVVGLAANAMFPVLPAPAWAVIHTVLAFLLVLVGRYGLFETFMKVPILLKVATVVLVGGLSSKDRARRRRPSGGRIGPLRRRSPTGYGPVIAEEGHTWLR